MEDIKKMPTDMRFQYIEYVNEQYEKRQDQYDEMEQQIKQRRESGSNKRMVKAPYNFN